MKINTSAVGLTSSIIELGDHGQVTQTLWTSVSTSVKQENNLISKAFLVLLRETKKKAMANIHLTRETQF